MSLSLLTLLFAFVVVVSGQQCETENFTVRKNNQIYFSVFASNGTCACSSFSGGGSALTGLENQPVIASLLARIAALEAQLQYTVPVGTIIPHGALTLPTGWLNCNGSEVSRTVYAALFQVLSVTYGPGDSVTTFNLPDLRGRTVIGTGQGAGLSLRSLGQILGEETHILSTSEMPSHSHGGITGGNNRGHTHEEIAVANCNSGGGGIRTTYNADCTGSGATGYPTGIQSAGESQNHLHSISAEGGSSAHNNMQPSVSLNYIIKT
jgi:microcystin-dependent protein